MSLQCQRKRQQLNQADTKTDTNGVETGWLLLVVVGICWLDFPILAAQPPRNCGNEERFCCSTVSGGLSGERDLFDSDIRLQLQLRVQ
jgi:hypothetical protein